MDIDDIKKKILEDVDPETKRKRAHERRVQRFVIALQSIAVIIVVLLIFYMLMGISTVQGNSMYPTLHDQDVVIYKRKNTEYRVGDVVAIKRPNGEEYEKRIVAVAGDTVNIQNGRIYVNGEELVTEQAIGETNAKSDDITYPLVVEDKQVFVLGDNREISRDSREIGTVKIDDIKGRIVWYMGKIK